jgi:HSP20 family protein
MAFLVRVRIQKKGQPMKFIRYQNSPLYNPLTNYSSLRDEMDRLFDVAFPTLSLFQRNGGFGDRRGEFPVDLYQEKDAFIVRAELPGFRKEEINVEVADGTLTITGFRKTETKSDSSDKETGTTTQERQVSRTITLPEHLKFEQIAATYESGVLTVTLPKSDQIKPKQIAIEVK